MSINQVCISGNLGSDSELRYTNSQMAVLGFSLCVNHRQKKGDKYVDKPNWVDCTMFGTRAEKLQPFLTKGAKVAVEGKLRYSSWEREGRRRSKIEVIVDELEFMSSRHRDGQPQPEPDQWPAEMPDVDAQYAAIPAQLPAVYDEDVPF